MIGAQSVPIELLQELAVALAETLEETPEIQDGELASEDIESLFADIAFRMAVKAMRIIPALKMAADGQGKAARKTLELLTLWLWKHSGQTITTGIGDDGLFYVSLGAHTFKGESVQDAYGQATSVIALEGDVN